MSVLLICSWKGGCSHLNWTCSQSRKRKMEAALISQCRTAQGWVESGILMNCRYAGIITSQFPEIFQMADAWGIRFVCLNVFGCVWMTWHFTQCQGSWQGRKGTLLLMPVSSEMDPRTILQRPALWPNAGHGVGTSGHAKVHSCSSGCWN